MNCKQCKHQGHCNQIPTDDAPDCFEPIPRDTRSKELRFDDDLSLIEAYASMRRNCPEVRINRRIKLSGKFVTLERIRAMRATV